MAQDVMGYTTLQVIPVLQGATANLEGQLSGPLVSAGRSAGQAAGQAVATGLAQAQAAVERASAALAAARDKEADAAGKVRVAELKLQELRDKGTATAAQIARAEEALATAQRGATRANQATRTAVDNLARARAGLANATDEAAESEGRFSRALSSINDRIGPAAKQMAGLAAATAGVGGAMATAAEALSREQSVDVLAAQLGATPDLAAEYGRIAGDLYKQGLGESFADVTSAIGAVQSGFATLGSEGEASIDQVTTNALNFSKMFGTEVPEAIQTVSQLVTNGLAKDSTEAFDLLVTSFQRVPVAMRDELPEILNEYGTHFRGLGFSGEQAFSLLVDYAAQGKFALDKAGDALKEFTLRGSDMSESSQAAYEKIKLDAQAMSDAIAAGGPRAQEALQLTAQGLLALEGESERANAAIALFGTPVEDLAVDQIPAFLEALAGGSSSMTGFAGSAEQAGQTLNDNTSNALERMKRSIQDGLVTGLTDAASWMEQNRGVAIGLGIAVATLGAALITAKVAAMGYAVAQGIMAAATGAGSAALAGNTLALGAYTIATGVIRGATLAWSAVQWVLNAALSANPIGLVVIAIGALIAGLVLAWQKSETFRNIVLGAVDAVKTGFSNAVEWVGGKITDFKNWLGGLGDKAGEVKDTIVGKFGDLVDWVTGLPGRLKDAGSGLFDFLINGYKFAINWLIGKWNSFSLGFDFEIPIINKRVSFTIDTPDLPLLAGGGVAGVDGSGRIYGPGSGTSDSILALDANSGLPTAFVSAGEGVVTAAAMANGGAELVAALNAGWVPPLDMLRALLPGLAGGGTIQVNDGDISDTQRGMWSAISSAFPDAVLTSATRYADVGSGYDYHMQGKAIDIAGPNMLQMAEWIAKNYPGSLELIHSNGFSHNIKNGEDVGSGYSFYGSDTMAGHSDHVHWSMSSAPTGPAVEQDSGAGTTPSLGNSGGGGTTGGGGGTAGGGTSGGTNSPSTERPAGTAVPVWVDNWPSNFGTGSGGTGSPSTDSPATTYQPSGGEDDTFDQAKAFETAFSNAQTNFTSAGQKFLSGQKSAIPALGGYVEGVEKVVQNINLVVADVAEGWNRVTREQKRQTAGR